MLAHLDTGLGHFLLLMLVVVPLLASVFGLLYHQELRAARRPRPRAVRRRAALGLPQGLLALLLMAGIVAWWLVLAHKSRQVAQEESNRQTHLLMREIDSHRHTDDAAAAGQAPRAGRTRPSRPTRPRAATSPPSATSCARRSTASWATRSCWAKTPPIPPHRKQAVSVIRRGGEHLLSLIEGTLDIARIEAGKLTLDVKPMRFRRLRAARSRGMFELQAAAKGLAFRFEVDGALPEVVRADEKRLRQILINLLGNAVKFTAQGQVTFRAALCARDGACSRSRTPAPASRRASSSAIFEPFARGSSRRGHVGAPAPGLGLTIAKMLTDLMGGELTVDQHAGRRARCSACGCSCRRCTARAARRAGAPRPRGAATPARAARMLVVDNEEADRELLVQPAGAAGLRAAHAASGHDCLDLLAAGLRPRRDPDGPGHARHRRLGDHAPRCAQLASLQRARSPSCRPTPSTRGWTTTPASRPEDFILKPVRHAELLDWLERAAGAAAGCEAPRAAPRAAPLRRARRRAAARRGRSCWRCSEAGRSWATTAAS